MSMWSLIGWFFEDRLPEIFVASTSIVWSWDNMISTSGAVIFSEAWKLMFDISVGFIRPIPPSLTGRASRSLIGFEHGGRPVSEGMNI